MSADAGHARPLKPKRGSGLSSRAALISVFAVGTMIFAALGWGYYDSQRAMLLDRVRSDLTSIRDLKRDQIAQWRSTLLIDGNALVTDPTISDEVDAWLAHPGDASVSGTLRDWLGQLRAQRGYAGAEVISEDGSRWLDVPRNTAPTPQEIDEVRAAAGSSEATLTDLYLDAETGKPQLDVVAPLRGRGQSARAVLMLHRDPESYLYPLIQSWPVPSATSETLLLRRDGDRILYLDNLRFSSGPALHLKLPITQANLLGVQALEGGARVVEGVDYRGHQGIGAVGPIQGSPWFIVAKVDVAEAYAPIDDTLGVTLTIVALTVLALGLGLIVVGRQTSLLLLRQRLEAERAENTLTRQYDFLTRYANDAIILADENFRIVQVNERADTMYGYSREEMLALTLADLHPAGMDLEGLREALVPDPSGVRLFETEHVTKDGALIDVEESARAIEYERSTRYVIVIRDITERKLVEEALQQRTEELERSNAELERFAYVASHDLQEPLRMVASYTQLLQQRYQGRLDSDADEFIGYAVDGASRMRTLINDLLAYSRVGTQGSPFVETDLEAVFLEVLGMLEPTLQGVGAVVTHDQLPAVRCDPVQLGQVFQNLLTNAMKFHGAEEPLIHVSSRRDGPEWVFSVSDNGIGIDPQYFDRIFVIFQRLESRAQFPGTGIGLAICKRIIARHGGRIWVESKPGAGSTFSFTLPADGKGLV